MIGATKEIPQLVGELVDISKEYLRQETIGRARLIGRHAGVAIATALVSALGVIFLAVAGVRLLIDVMPGEPGHQIWSGLAYVISAMVLVAVGALITMRASR